MKFEPKTEAEINEQRLLAPGEYDYEVQAAKDHVSSAGNESIKLTLRVFGNDGKVLVDDYLGGTAKMAWKLRHYAESCGLLSKYESGEISPEDCEGRTGRCILDIQGERKSESGQMFRAKNTVKDYVPVEEGTVSTQVPLESDDLPF